MGVLEEYLPSSLSLRPLLPLYFSICIYPPVNFFFFFFRPSGRSIVLPGGRHSGTDIYPNYRVPGVAYSDIGRGLLFFDPFLLVFICLVGAFFFLSFSAVRLIYISEPAKEDCKAVAKPLHVSTSQYPIQSNPSLKKKTQQGHLTTRISSLSFPLFFIDSVIYIIFSFFFFLLSTHTFSFFPQKKLNKQWLLQQ